jgi:hypothetical protein
MDVINSKHQQHINRNASFARTEKQHCVSNPWDASNSRDASNSSKNVSNSSEKSNNRDYKITSRTAIAARTPATGDMRETEVMS